MDCINQHQRQAQYEPRVGPQAQVYLWTAVGDCTKERSSPEESARDSPNLRSLLRSSLTTQAGNPSGLDPFPCAGFGSSK